MFFKNNKSILYKSLIVITLSFLILYILFINLFTENYNKKITHNYHEALTDYINLKEDVDSSLKLIEHTENNNNNLDIYTYSLQSQVWPKVGPKSDQIIWTHKVVVYIPTEIQNKTALLWINGGTNKEPNKSLNNIVNNNVWPYPSYPLDFEKIALSSKSIVIDLQDVPNQYLTLDNKQYAEDALIAYTWSKFVDDPVKYKYFPAYLPMVKAVIKTLDSLDKLKLNNTINNYVLSGLSKRGMTTWLSGLHDERVKAIIPVAIDMLNFKNNIEHIYNTHQSWPIALHDYYEQNVVQKLSSPNSKHLREISDPLQYIECSECSLNSKNRFSNRAKIKKYIISASGDDFFTPDSNQFYFYDLPGQNYLRYIPNSAHYIDNSIVSEAILTSFYNLSYDITMPEFTSSVEQKNNIYYITISTNKKPQNITLYSSYNKKSRDFRYNSGIKYTASKILDKNTDKSSSIGTNYTYTIPITIPKSGWLASFVELEYESNNNLPNLKLTTPVEILPNKYPKLDKLAKIKEYGKKVFYKQN